MTSIQPYLDVPKFIVEGLGNGSMFRTGGVIQETASGQIVAWLRETGDSDRGQAVTQSLFGTAGVDAGAMGFMFGSATMLLPIALNAHHTRRSEKRIVDKLTKVIEREFWLDRMAKYNAAREDFNKAYHVTNTDEKRHKLRTSRDRLSEVKWPIYSELDRLQDCSGLSDEDGEKAYYLHLLAMNLHGMITTCYLELDEPDVAKMTLNDAIKHHYPYVRTFVRKRIGLDSLSHQSVWQRPDREAIFNRYSSVSSFTHYIKLIDWLGGSGYQTIPKPVSSRMGSFLRNTTDSLAESRFENFITAVGFQSVILPQSYAMIENLDRLRGVALKLSFTAAPGRTFFLWEEYETKAAASHKGIVTFVDKDKLSLGQKLRAKFRR